MDEEMKAQITKMMKELNRRLNELEEKEAESESSNENEEEPKARKKPNFKKGVYHRYFCKEPKEIAEGIIRNCTELETLLNKALVVLYETRTSQFRQGVVEGLLKPILLTVERLEKKTNGN